MSHATSIVFAPSSVDGRIRRLVSRAFAAFKAARQRWQEASRAHACHQAIRGLDRRTLQDLGLYADGAQWPRDGALNVDCERLRW